MVADEIGADYEDIVVRHGDTGSQPVGVGTFGSRSLAIGGSAIVRASEKVREKAIRIAAHMLEASPGDIEFTAGEYRVKGVPSRSLGLNEIAARAYSDNLPDDIDTGLEATDFFRPPDFIYPFGTHVAVVEVEKDTGVISLREFYSVDDCGPRISPLLVEGQIHGGLAQGIGQALLEQVLFDDQGQLLTGTMMDYTMPRADDFPSFTIAKTVTETTLNPLGAKGIGEAATIGSDAGRGQRRGRRARTLRPASSRHAADAASHLGSDQLGLGCRMSSRYSLSRDLDELERMVERLVDYLLGDAMYLPVGGGFFRGASTPQMTLGALLLRRRRLAKLRGKLKRADSIRLDDVLAQHDSLQREWTLHYEQKLQREVPMRLKLMAGFFREFNENPRDCAGAYPAEALRRAIVQGNLHRDGRIWLRDQ